MDWEVGQNGWNHSWWFVIIYGGEEIERMNTYLIFTWKVSIVCYPSDSTLVLEEMSLVSQSGMDNQ